MSPDMLEKSIVGLTSRQILGNRQDGIHIGYPNPSRLPDPRVRRTKARGCSLLASWGLALSLTFESAQKTFSE